MFFKLTHLSKHWYNLFVVQTLEFFIFFSRLNSKCFSTFTTMLLFDTFIGDTHFRYSKIKEQKNKTPYPNLKNNKCPKTKIFIFFYYKEVIYSQPYKTNYCTYSMCTQHQLSSFQLTVAVQQLHNYEYIIVLTH